MRNQITIQGIALETRLGTVLPVLADFGQLRQALVNVILNATEAMPRGGSLVVCTRLLPDRPAVEIEIRDTGAGIAAEHLPRIFDPFYTTKEKGTGLGLSVVYGVVEQHGGKIEIQSEVGKGTVMLIRLPVAPAADP